MKEIYTLAGNWKVTLADGSNYDMVLPGTLDTNNIGYADKGTSGILRLIWGMPLKR